MKEGNKGCTNYTKRLTRLVSPILRTVHSEYDEQQLAQSWTHGAGQAQAGIAREHFECGLRWWDRLGVVFAGVRSVCGARLGACVYDLYV